MKETAILVDGMMCPRCENHVKKALEALDEITEAVSDHTTGKVTVKHESPLDEEKIKAAVTDAGYDYKGIE